MDGPSIRTGLLRGRDHPLLGSVSALADGDVAVALSRGGAKKTYSHSEPNEDACAFAFGSAGAMLAVADGHWGAGGATLAIESLLERHASRWLADYSPDVCGRWNTDALETLWDLNRTLLRAGESADRVGRTTLSVCVWRHNEPALLAFAMGDSHIFEVSEAQTRELLAVGDEGTVFVGDARLDRAGLETGARVLTRPGPAGRALILATDGLSEPGIGVADPAAAVAASVAATAEIDPELRPLATARGLAERALDSHRHQAAGDNIATACLWL